MKQAYPNQIVDTRISMKNNPKQTLAVGKITIENKKKNFQKTPKIIFNSIKTLNKSPGLTLETTFSFTKYDIPQEKSKKIKRVRSRSVTLKKVELFEQRAKNAIFESLENKSLN